MLRRNNAAGSLFRTQWVTGALKTRAESIATRCPIPFSDGAIQFLDFERRSRCERLQNRWSAARKRVSTGCEERLSHARMTGLFKRAPREWYTSRMGSRLGRRNALAGEINKQPPGGNDE